MVGEGCRGRGHGRVGLGGGTSLEGGTKGPKILGHCPPPQGSMWVSSCQWRGQETVPGLVVPCGRTWASMAFLRAAFCTPTPISTPPSTAVPPSNSPVPAGYWLNGGTSARLCTGLSGLRGESFRSPCAQPQASPSPGRDTTSDSACHVTRTGQGTRSRLG